MNEIWEIVRMSAKDAPALFDLLAWRRSGAVDQPPPEDPGGEELAEMQRHMASDSLFVWAARVEGRLAGYVAVARILKPDTRIYFWVDELWVAPSYRRQGIALALVRRVIEVGRDLGMWCVRLSAADTPAAHNLYKKAGFNVDEGGWSEFKL